MENFILCEVHYAVSNENSISYIAIGFKLKLRFDTIFLVKITSENMTLTKTVAIPLLHQWFPGLEC